MCPLGVLAVNTAKKISRSAFILLTLFEAVSEILRSLACCIDFSEKNVGFWRGQTSAKAELSVFT